MPDFVPDAALKLKAIRRELSYRRRVYPRWVADRRKTQQEAGREIAVFEAIEADYAAIVEANKPPELF